jgi:hypothetical protein
MFAYHKAILENVCGHPVRVIVLRYDMFDPVDQLLNPGEQTIVMNNDCLDTHGFFTIQSSRYAIDRLSSCLQRDYKMMISANGKELSVDDTGMLKILEKADYSHGTYSYNWMIRDPSLCP